MKWAGLNGKGRRGHEWDMDAEFFRALSFREASAQPPGLPIAACTAGNDYDDPKNRGVRRQDSWLISTCREAVLVDATDDGWAYVLGENGTVVRFNWKVPKPRTTS